MNTSILLFAGIRQRAGQARLELSLPAGATVGEMRKVISGAYPDLQTLLQICRVAVDQTFVDDTSVIPENAEIALIPPVSGGHDGPRTGPHSLLTPDTLELAAVLGAVEHAGAGGVTSFIGNVRRHSRGKMVRFLEYEAYGPMAVRALEHIASTIETRYPDVRLCVHHRVGHLEVGEAAVIIAASAPHRAEAFAACRDCIESLKKDVPIWKREVDEIGDEWISQGP
ncbi:MAG: molybdopterin converting factor subunit 1 [Nannocystaceae bacterium]